MMSLPQTDMIKATRLTREGRLGEAMAILQGALTGAAPSSGYSPSRDAGAKPQDDGSDILDMVPPSAASGSSWTAAGFDESPLTDKAGDRRSETPRDHPGDTFPVRSGSRLASEASSAEARMRRSSPDGARFDERSYANAAGRRDFKLYVPGCNDGQSVPLLVMLHGCTQSPDDFAAGTRMNELAEELGFLVAYPAQARSANPSRCWNWFNARDQRRDEGEPSLIAGITRQIMAEFAVDPSRVYIAGLSAGGAAAAVMGSAYPDLYAAIGIHSGLACGIAGDVPGALAAMRHGGGSTPHIDRQAPIVPTIVFHGDRDRTVNPINGDQVIARAGAHAGLQTTTTRGKSDAGMGYTRIVQKDARGRPMLEQWVVHGAGHAWSGGSAAGSYTEPRGPDAGRAMMRFFLQHQTAVERPG